MIQIGAVSKIGLHTGSFRFCQSVLPLVVACSHLVASIHLHSLIITEQVSPFYTLFLPLQLWPGRIFHNSTCVATQKVSPSPNFCRNSVALALGFPQAWGNEEKRKSESMCNIQRNTDWRGRECGSTPAEKETWFIIAKNQLQMSAHRFSLCCQL